MDKKKRTSITPQCGNNEETSKEDVNISFKYSKRKGTSITMIGCIYKTNLLSLILYRTLVDKRNDFVLGCNVDGIGTMSEICCRYNDNQEKPIVVFLQTKYKDAMTDKDWNSANSDFSLLNCYQNFLLIRDRFNNDKTDPLFKGNFDEVVPYLIIHTPNSCKIKNRIAVSLTDSIFSNILNGILISEGDVNKIFKIDHKSSIEDIIYENIECIGKTIAAYTSLDDGDPENISKEFLNIINKYYTFLIPDVIKINEINGNCYGEFNDSLFESSNKYHIRLKSVLYNEVLKISKVKRDTEISHSHASLLIQNGDLIAFIANGLTIDDNNKPVIYQYFQFNEITKKLVLRPGLPPEIAPEELVQSIKNIKVTKEIMDKALEVAGTKMLKTLIKIVITKELKEVITTLKVNDDQNTENWFAIDIQEAKQFLNSLYIYSEQSKDMTMLVKKEVRENQAVCSSGSIFAYQPESLYIQLYNKVQKWWLLQAEPYYLTNNNCNFVEQDTAIELPYLCILNLRHMNEVGGYSLKFKTDSLELFKNICYQQNHSITNIISNDVLISSLKLAQYFDQSDKSSIIADFEHVSNMQENEFKKLTEELSKANIDTFNFVILLHKIINNKLNRFHEIVEVFTQNIIIVSKSELTDVKTILMKDTTSLSDIENADEVLKYKITVQGIEDELGVIINDDMKHVVNAGILSKIIKQEKIKIGKNLSDSTYEKLKDYFMERKIRSDVITSIESEQELSVLLDIQNPVVTIIAAPGMGKSKLLTHLSVKTKCKFPCMWIIRMNLLDYCEDFNNWHEHKTDIGLKESMNLVCKAEIGNSNKFSLEFIDGVLVLNNNELEGTELLHLELIIASFNDGHICFIFDGFDEICPHYGKVVVQFMKCFVDYNEINLNRNSSATSTYSRSNLRVTENRHRIWISSRPYNTIKSMLIKNFATTVHLQHLNKDEQTFFYHKYWEDHLKIEKLSKKQFENVEAFFEYMNKYRQSEDMQLKSPTISVVPLRLMHEAAVDFFREKYSSHSTDMNKSEVLDRWISKSELQTVDKCNSIYGRRQYLKGLELAGTPLHMHIYADLFVSEIKGTSANRNWEPDVHTFEFYERFLETKLKKIRFKDKSGEDVDTANSKIFFAEEKKRFTADHKWLALHALFPKLKIIYLIEPGKWNYFRKKMDAIKKGKEKTGLIDRIHNGVPRFVHLVFTEYFAVECVADLLKTSSMLNMDFFIHFTFKIFLRSTAGIISVFDHKVKRDENLRKRLTGSRIMKLIFGVIINNNSSPWNYDRYEIDRDKTALVKLLEYGSTNTVMLLLQSLEGNLNTENVNIFMAVISRDFFVHAIKYDGIIEYMLGSVRKVDPSTIRQVLDQCGLDELTDDSSDEEIVKQMHTKLTTREVPT